MSMVSSYCTLLSQAPPQQQQGKISGVPGNKLGKPQLALPYVPTRKQSSLFVCHAQQSSNNKHTYNLQPFALVHPKFPPTSEEHWRITEDEDHINLWFFVERSTTKEQLEVATEDDVLLIKYKDADGSNPASNLDVRLLIPPGYDKKKVEAELAFGSLLVTVTKPKHTPNYIAIGDKPSSAA